MSSKLCQLEDAYSDLFTASSKCLDTRDLFQLLFDETNEPAYIGIVGTLNASRRGIDAAMDTLRGEIDKLELDDDG